MSAEKPTKAPTKTNLLIEQIKTALGMLNVKVKKFIARLEALGIASDKYHTATAIIDIFGPQKQT